MEPGGGRRGAEGSRKSPPPAMGRGQRRPQIRNRVPAGRLASATTPAARPGGFSRALPPTLVKPKGLPKKNPKKNHKTPRGTSVLPCRMRNSLGRGAGGSSPLRAPTAEPPPWVIPDGKTSPRGLPTYSAAKASRSSPAPWPREGFRDLRDQGRRAGLGEQLPLRLLPRAPRPPFGGGRGDVPGVNRGQADPGGGFVIREPPRQGGLRPPCFAPLISSGFRDYHPVEVKTEKAGAARGTRP